MKIIPQPKKLEKLHGQFKIEQNDAIFCDGRFRMQAERFAAMVQNYSGITLTFTDEINAAKIIFSKDDKPEENYLIMLSQGVATVKCGGKSGCFYAVETLRQLFCLDDGQKQLVCDDCYIEDAPKFKYRGLMLDICRHYFDLDTIKQVVELMSQVKLNKLHLHLSDDQGFRIQIDKYPLLNQIGSVRYGSQLISSDANLIDDKLVQGYLTKDDVRSLVAYAQERGVEIIPEIDLPGHFVAALAAYPQYCCTGQVAEVRRQWGISKDILCAGNDEVYTFVCDILDEVAPLFPSQYFHLGGDEVPKDRWCNCKLCLEKMSKLQLNGFDELQTYMVEVFRKHLEQKGKTVICRNDGITQRTDKNIVMQVWKPHTAKQGAQQANDGRKVIMSPFFNMYFDYPYARIPLGKTLKYNPARGVKKENLHNVLGVEGCLWTEYVINRDKLFFNLLPRIDALAECGWGYRGKNFNRRLKKRFNLYNVMGLLYNGKAHVGSGRNRGIVKKFFQKDADVEVNIYLDKHR